MHLVLYQPEIPQNAGTLLRLSACLGLSVHMIEPFGFLFSERRMRRAGMDYMDHVDLTIYTSWQAFLNQNNKTSRRLILLTPHTSEAYMDFKFEKDDMIIVGRESSGVPEDVFKDCSHYLAIPMNPGLRSLNVAIAASMVLGEALRQTDLFPPLLT